MSEMKSSPSGLGLMMGGVFAEIFPAYLNSPPKVQATIRELVALYHEAKEEKDRLHAKERIATLLVGSSPIREQRGISLEEYEKSIPDSEAITEKLARQEATFAQRLAQCLQQKQMTQAELAAAVGVGQPSISMMLARTCRPQRRTVEKIAAALGVPVADLWPEDNLNKRSVN